MREERREKTDDGVPGVGDGEEAPDEGGVGVGDGGEGPAPAARRMTRLLAQRTVRRLVVPGESITPPAAHSTT